LNTVPTSQLDQHQGSAETCRTWAWELLPFQPSLELVAEALLSNNNKVYAQHCCRFFGSVNSQSAATVTDRLSEAACCVPCWLFLAVVYFSL
jgi:hypothetical protein